VKRTNSVAYAAENPLFLFYALLQDRKFHRKRLYCPNCRRECNAVEIRNEFERKEFLDDFKQGKFIEEAKESVMLCAKSCI